MSAVFGDYDFIFSIILDFTDCTSSKLFGQLPARLKRRFSSSDWLSVVDHNVIVGAGPGCLV